jgi:acid phosphatase family membrane protein YuiD
MIEGLLASRIFLSCLLAYLIAQFIKSVLDISEGGFRFSRLFETGGMPSSHAAVVTALALSVYYATGTGPLFVVTLIFSLVVLRDAFGVRQATGQNTEAIKRIISTLKIRGMPDLQLIMGHTFFQVLIGTLIGLASAVFIQHSPGSMSLLLLWGTALYFAMPGLVANMAPIFVRKIEFLNYPVDFRKGFLGKRLFGDHKTYRGFFFAAVTSIVLLYIQKLLSGIAFFDSISYLDYGSMPPGDVIYLGLLLGIGAMLGDLVKSFVKRRLGISPGTPFFPWDQLDYVVGILCLVWLYKAPTFEMSIALLVLAPLAHIVVRFFGYKIGMNKEMI